MSEVPKFDLTGKSQADRERIFMEEARRPPVYITEDGQRVSYPQPLARASLRVAWPRQGGLVDVDPRDEMIRSNVYREVGRGDLSPDEYRDALEFLAKEKGWRVVWPAEVLEAPATASAPAGEPQPVKRRGRPPGSKNKKKAADG